MARMTLKKWLSTYKPITNPLRRSAPFDGCLFDSWNEKEKQEAFKSCVANPNSIWTLMENENRLYIVAGWGLANRLGYFVCSAPFESEADAPEIALWRI